MANPPKAPSAVPAAPRVGQPPTAQVDPLPVAEVKGSGALLVWLQDRHDSLQRMVKGVLCKLVGGHVYPLPIESLSEIKAFDGRDIYKEGEDPKGLAFHYDPEAQALSDDQLDEISVDTFVDHRKRLEDALGLVNHAIDSARGMGTYNRLYERGARRTRLNGKHVKRAGAEGSVNEVIQTYHSLPPEQQKEGLVIPPLFPPLPDWVVVLEGDPLICGACGETFGTIGDQASHRQRAHISKVKQRKPGTLPNGMPGTEIDRVSQEDFEKALVVNKPKR